MHQHIVQFYENEAFLIKGLADYIRMALTTGGKGVVIATADHLHTLSNTLTAQGLMSPDDPDCGGNYIALQAEALLPLFMVDGLPDEARFAQVIGAVLASAGQERPVHVFGEMVAILCGGAAHEQCDTDRYAAAIEVERCFNRLMERQSFSLLCGYPLSAFPRQEDAAAFHDICRLHSNVIPTEHYDPDVSADQLQREIAGLQQKAFALEAEVRQRIDTEQALLAASYDQLTGLPNRRLFLDRLAHDIKKAHRARLQLALFFIDLDYFKEINDTLGHDKGDALLRQVGQRLAQCVREVDTVARLGGDEFTVILSELTDPDSVARVAQAILQKMTAPFRLGGDLVHIAASIGVTLYPQDAGCMQDLLKNADQAMYASKQKGGDRATFFTPAMQEATQARMRVAGELRNAVRGDQLRLLYQPIVDMASGAICKAEALLRWQHPVRGLIRPGEFISIAESSGLIMPISDWVFEQAMQQCAGWRRHDPAFQISINIPAVQFHQEGSAGNHHCKWIGRMDRISRQQHYALPDMTLEIPESLLQDANPAVARQLQRLHQAGIQLALDDFGGGCSTLTLLRKYHITYLKIDQAHVHALERDPESVALCEAIIAMAHKMGLKVVAEGVETAGQRDLLASAGCDLAQGYLYSAPLRAAEFDSLLTQNARRNRGGQHSVV